MLADRNASPTKILSAFGVNATKAGELLSGIGTAVPGVRLIFQSYFPVIRIELKASGHNSETLNAALEDAGRWVTDKLGDWIFTFQGESMAEVVGRLLGSRKATLAVAESCTGGLISSLLTDVPGSSNYFLFGGITYSNQSKMNILNVPLDTIRQFGAVHEKTAKEMAAGVRLISGADYGISTSGIAGPDGGTPEKPVGTVCLGIATPTDAHGYRFCFPEADRAMNKQVFALAALDLLRRDLLGLDIGRFFS